MNRWLTLACVLLWLTATPAVAETITPEAGMLLVARPELPDPRFREAVVLLVQHGPEGTAGLILNRPSHLALAEVLPELPPAATSEGMLSYGGPVAPRAFIVLLQAQGEPPEPAQKVLKNVYLTGAEQFLAWFEKTRTQAPCRVFTGYSGWSSGQLEREMVRGDWQLLQAEERMVFSSEVAGLWRELVRHNPPPAP